MVEVRNEQNFIRVNAARVRRLAEFVLRREKAGRPGLAIRICGDACIRRYHRDFMNDDTATDVLAFQGGEAFDKKAAAHLGDVLVSAETALKRAPEFGCDGGEELERYIVHGILHLLGFKDKNSSAARRMRAKQEEYLAAFRRAKKSS